MFEAQPARELRTVVGGIRAGAGYYGAHQLRSTGRRDCTDPCERGGNHTGAAAVRPRVSQ